jgi:hypothetical protein
MDGDYSGNLERYADEISGSTRWAARLPLPLRLWREGSSVIARGSHPRFVSFRRRSVAPIALVLAGYVLSETIVNPPMPTAQAQHATLPGGHAVTRRPSDLGASAQATLRDLAQARGDGRGASQVPASINRPMDDLPDLSRLDSMNALEKLRLLTEIVVREKKAAAALAATRAEMAGIAVQMGALLFGLRNGELAWEGAPTECLMAERPMSDDDEFDEDLDEDDEDDDDEDSDLWSVNVEVDLLTRIREQGFDLDELLAQHHEEMEETGAVVVATPAQLPSGAWFAVLTALDATTATSRTYVFAMARKL